MADLNEQEIRRLVEEAVQQLGANVSGDAVSQVVQEAAAKINTPANVSAPLPQPLTLQQNRIIVTAFGKNRRGILAGLTGVLSESGCDILDLSQKLLQEFFTTMLLVDISESSLPFEEIKTKVTAKGEELDLKVIIQHEAIFNAMHRV